MTAQTDFAERLTQLKGDLNISAFARKVGIGVTTLRKYLEGATPGADKLVQIARALNVDVGWLATGEGSARSENDALPPLVLKRLRELVQDLGGDEAAAQIAGIGKQQVGRWRRGASSPPLSGVAKLCHAGGKPLDWLFSGERAPQSRPTPPSVPAAQVAPAHPIEITIIVNQAPGLLRRLFSRGQTTVHTIKTREGSKS